MSQLGPVRRFWRAVGAIKEAGRKSPAIGTRRCRVSFVGESMVVKLPNEWLGLKGKYRSQELCVEPMLAANKSGNDVMRWDFIVELPEAPSDAGRFLDQRPAGPD
jgi:hypothetical protein